MGANMRYHVIHAGPVFYVVDWQDCEVCAMFTDDADAYAARDYMEDTR